MNIQEFYIYFDDLSLAEAGIEAEQLKNMLEDTSKNINAKLRKENLSSMDMGTALILSLLGTPAIIEVAKGLSAWICRRGGRPGSLRIEFVDADGQVKRLQFNGESADAAKIAEALCSSATNTKKI